MIPEDEYPDLSRVLGALSHPIRREVFLALVRQPRDVMSLVEDLSLDQPVLSMHLSALRRLGLAMAIKAGKRRIYAVGPRTAVGRDTGELRIECDCAEGVGIVLAFPKVAEAAIARWDRLSIGREAGGTPPRGQVDKRGQAGGDQAVGGRTAEPARGRSGSNQDRQRIDRASPESLTAPNARRGRRSA